jgi:hypothetical protein
VIHAFDSGQQEATMPFSMPSYFLGVGTVVGALAFGFGGGVLLTKTAIKDTPPSRIERAARAETPVAPQITEARAVPRTEPTAVLQPATESAPQVQAAVEPPKPVAETPKQEPVKVVEPARQVELPKQTEPKQVEQRQSDAPKQIEQREAEPQMMTEREQRRVERRMERERRYAERKARAMAAYARMRQRPVDDPQQEDRQPARPELAFEREAPRPNLFEGLFGRPQDTAPGDGRE